MKAKYQIVEDSYNGFEVQKRRWWFPFWIQYDVNTFPTVESAEKFARGLQQRVVKVLD